MAENTQQYDSREDTLAHIYRVQYFLGIARGILVARGKDHDASKLEEPEKSAFDACVPKLKNMTYGSDEYKAALAELGLALAHHYASNSHHPEHFKLFRCAVCKEVLRQDQTWLATSVDPPQRLCSLCCRHGAIYECEALPYISVEGMSLFDVIEMLMDWKAATERMKDGGDIRKSLRINTGRFSLTPQLASILANTIQEMGW